MFFELKCKQFNNFTIWKIATLEKRKNKRARAREKKILIGTGRAVQIQLHFAN